MAAYRVHNIMIPPRDAVGYLAMLWSTGLWTYGSGALIDSRHVLTCSHNLIDPVTDPPPAGRAQQIRFYPAYNRQRPTNPPSNGLPIGVGIYSTRFQQGDDAWDVAVCRLANQINPVPVRYFVPTVAGEGLLGEEVCLTGYPGPRQGELWEDLDEVAGLEFTTNTLLYTHDTWGGNSGSPTWKYDSIDDVVPQYAIHVSRQPQQLRRGVLITAAIHAWIQHAVATPAGAAPGFQLVGL